MSEALDWVRHLIKKQWIQDGTGGKQCYDVCVDKLVGPCLCCGVYFFWKDDSEVPVFLEPSLDFLITYTVIISEVKSGVSRMWVLCIVICYFSHHWWAKREPSMWSSKTTTTRKPDQRLRRVPCGCFLLRSPPSLMVSCPCRDGGYGCVQFHWEQCVWHLDRAWSSLGSADSGCGLRILRECFPP